MFSLKNFASVVCSFFTYWYLLQSVMRAMMFKLSQSCTISTGFFSKPTEVQGKAKFLDWGSCSSVSPAIATQHKVERSENAWVTPARAASVSLYTCKESCGKYFLASFKHLFDETETRETRISERLVRDSPDNEIQLMMTLSMETFCQYRLFVINKIIIPCLTVVFSKLIVPGGTQGKSPPPFKERATGWGEAHRILGDLLVLAIGHDLNSLASFSLPGMEKTQRDTGE